MENEKDTNNFIDEKESEFNYIYYLDYVDQKIDNNINFQKWKISVLKKYGNNSKLFRCIKDKIYFYIKYENCINFPGFYVKCPICKKYICCFCSYSSYETNYIKCCLRRSISIALLIDAPNFVNNEIDHSSSNYTEFLIPGFSIINIFVRINNILFCTIAKKISKDDKSGKLEISDTIENEIYDRCIYLIPLSLVVPFFIISAYILILLVFISIPFNNYPLKYYYGFLLER